MSGTFSGNGSCHIIGQLARNNWVQNEILSFRLLVNNSKCKVPVIGVQVKLNREMVITSLTSAGQTKEWKNSQPVIKHEYKLAIAAKVPDLIAEDFTLRLTSGIVNVDCENGRFFYGNDVVEDGRPVPNQMVSVQKRILTSMKTSLMTVSY